MTTSRALYVHAFLPGATQPVPAGKLTVDQEGRLAAGTFFYGRRYAARPEAYALDPEVLPLVPGVDYRQSLRDLDQGGGLFLALQDALPDGWGRRVLAAAHGGHVPDDVSLLSEANDARTGALVFSASQEWSPDAEPVERATLDELAEAARALEVGLEAPLHLKRLLRKGSSLGGARPKTQVERDGRLWLAKFQSASDEYDYPTLEAATTELARRCGLRVPEFRLELIGRKDKVLLLERFDRPVLESGGETRFGRRHYLSASTLVGLPYRSTAGSYAGIAEKLRQRSTDAREDLAELFARMVFNILVDNTDDHLKNHGLLLERGDYYRLAPAFDVVMQLTNLGYQSLEVGTQGTVSTVANAISAASHFGMNQGAARARAEEIVAIIREWPEVFAQYEADAELTRRVTATLTARLQQAGV
jgi:serine/threonine-protein kinase HipA